MIRITYTEYNQSTVRTPVSLIQESQSVILILSCLTIKLLFSAHPYPFQKDLSDFHLFMPGLVPR
jgi:hypothetical protein